MKHQTPKNVMIKDHLIHGITSRQFRDRLPSENMLAEKFNVSRMTARKAVSDLEAQGLVERIQGKGTFVRRPDFSMGYFSIQPSRKQAGMLGVDYSSRVLELVMLNQPPKKAARTLGYDGQTIRARRIHCFDGRAVRYEIRYLRGDLCGGILWEDLEKVSIHELLVTKYELPLSRVWQRIRAVALTKDIAGIFGESEGYPAFYIERVTYTADTPVTYVEYYIRGEMAFEDTFAPGAGGPPQG
ncbi:MAG: GntR family transcriptional regulator [Pseudomonadota bacterium]